MKHRVLIAVLVAQLTSGTIAQGQEITRAEYGERRARVMEQLGDGILLLHARSTEKAMEQWGFVQDGTFLYFTGLPDLPGAILALDGPRGEARLWTPPARSSFGVELHGLGVRTGERAARENGLTSVEEWDDFVPWVESRLAQGVRRIYLDGSRRPEASGAPSGMRPVAGDRTLWRASVEEAFPSSRWGPTPSTWRT